MTHVRVWLIAAVAVLNVCSLAPFVQGHQLGHNKPNVPSSNAAKQKSPQADSTEALNNEEDLMYQCVVLEDGSGGRQKRKVANFTAGYKNKWNVDMIPYEIDTAFADSKKDRIRVAVAEWEAKTCIRFQEYTNASSHPNYIFVKDGTSCSSSIGMTSGQQSVNLKYNSCFGQLNGRLMHEFGHKLGLYHEQARPDGATYVALNLTNIQSGYAVYFEPELGDKIDTHGVAYDYSSVMHYGPKDFNIDSNYFTIMTIDPLYQRNLGNLDEITFFDAQAINRALCEPCDTTTECEHGGYPDPSDPDNDSCDKCICHDAFSGDLCATVTAASGPTSCSQNGEVSVTSTDWSCISFGPYSSGTSCNWLLKSNDSAGTLDFKFDTNKAYNIECGGFNSGNPCRHYAEVRYKDQEVRGPRFCCDDRPTVTLTSDTDEITVIFRSVRSMSGTKDGFGMCFRQTP